MTVEPRIIPPGGGAVATIWNFATVTKVSAADTGGQYSGLERYYEKVASFVRNGAKPDVPSILAVSTEHGVEVDMLSLLDIIERHKVELA